jgi:hypothetical protein
VDGGVKRVTGPKSFFANGEAEQVAQRVDRRVKRRVWSNIVEWGWWGLHGAHLLAFIHVQAGALSVISVMIWVSGG